jgi:hypothetical protein
MVRARRLAAVLITATAAPPLVANRYRPLPPITSSQLVRWSAMGGPSHRASVPLSRLGLMADNSLSVRDRESFLAEPHVKARHA